MVLPRAGAARRLADGHPQGQSASQRGASLGQLVPVQGRPGGAVQGRSRLAGASRPADPRLPALSRPDHRPQDRRPPARFERGNRPAQRRLDALLAERRRRAGQGRAVMRALGAAAAGLLALLLQAAQAAELPRATEKLLADLKLSPAILSGLDTELDIPKDWIEG